MRFEVSHKVFFICVLVLALQSPALLAQNNPHSLAQILGEIESLENKSDPKCYATAARLEDFMFGTPLSDQARFTKNDKQKQWLLSVWQKASEIAKSKSKPQVSEEQVKLALQETFKYQQDDKGHWVLNLNSGNILKIHKDDKRQYGSIAYSLRTLLAIQQELMMSFESEHLPLEQSAIKQLTQALDLFSLAVLKVADEQARKNDKYEIEKSDFLAVWQVLQGSDTKPTLAGETVAKMSAKAKPIQLKLLKAIVEQKVRSYAAYNDISNQLFVRNLQVYFARNRWPADDAQAKEFRQNFTETLIAFAADLYTGAQQLALSRGEKFIREVDVSNYTQLFIPHRINEYEDAIFFPALAANQQVTIESYDMDAFRDSGIHWRYLQFAVLDSNYIAYLEPDPFAAELLSENIAQFGVLLLRVTGEVGKSLGDKRISLSHFAKAIELIQSRINKNTSMAKQGTSSAPSKLKSSPSNKQAQTGDNLFSDVSDKWQLNFMHRSSDWLNRSMRSYIKTGKDTGTLTIPPAFGGSGVAAGDINNDGKQDLLILSGLGNRLYLNRGEHYEDVTKQSGLSWRRAQDNLPGEPRQPLIADIDNDGWQDIVITYVNDAHRVYRNLGDGKFKDMTEQSGLGGEGLVGGPATFFDFDNDGLLDIYITYFGDYLNGQLPSLRRRNTNGLPNKLFRNTGNFRFEDVTEGSGLANTGWGQAVTHMDLDNDNLQDLIVGNDFGVNGYYRNLGDGKFEDISNTINTDKPSYTMGIGSADLNDDLIPDIYISNIVTMNKDEKYVMPSADTTMKFNPEKLANMRVIEANDLFISKGSDNTLAYQHSQLVGRGYSSTGWSWDADFFDFDNDGDDDLYVLNGMNEFSVYSNDNPYYTDPLTNEAKNVHIPVATKETNVLFQNKDGRLKNISANSGAELLGNSRSAVYLDIDEDGDLDMVLNNYHEKAVLYRNNAERLGNHFLKIKLIGSPASKVNRDAIGAKLLLSTNDGQRRWRLIQGATGYMSVHPKLQHFGLLKHQTADLEVIWPDGKRTKHKNLKANSSLTIRYDDAVKVSL